MKKTWLYVAALSACFAMFLIARPSFAQVGGGQGPMPRHFPHAPPTPPPSAAGPGKIRLTIENGERGPLVLTQKNDGFVGQFVVWNDGQGPLTISRVTTRGDDDDPRLPPRFTARFADGGGGSSVIQPHSSKRVNVTWVPDHEPKVHQALGHVVLTSNDEVAGEVAMGFVSPMTGPYSFVTAHLLTWLFLLPIFGAFVALAMHLIGYEQDEKLRGVTLGYTAVQCLLAIVLYGGFSGAVTRIDGNDGFQFVERSVLLHAPGVEYFVGVDGTSVSLVLLTAVLGFVGAIASYGVPRTAVGGNVRAYYGAFALLLAGAMGAFISLDLSLFAASWIAMLVALVALLVVGGSALRSAATMKLAVCGGVSSALLLFAVGALYLHSDPTFLADGTRVEHTFAIPELMRVAYNAKHLELLGCSWVKVVWVALFLAFAVLTPLIPLHRWFVDVASEAPLPVRVLLGGVVSNAGVYGLLRVSFGILPDGSRWAATTLVAFGVVNIALGAILAFRQSDIRKLVAYAALGQMGFCLVGLGAMTREGIAGCIMQMFSHGVITAMLFLLVGALYERAKTGELAKLGGLASEMPLYAAFAGFALLASAGMPGLSGFWGELLPLVGAFPLQRALVAIAAVGAAFAALTLLRTLRQVFLGSVRESGRKDSALTDAGGTWREIEWRELASVLPLLLLCVALGFYPAPFFMLIQGGVSDQNQLVNPPGPDEIAMLDDAALR